VHLRDGLEISHERGRCSIPFSVPNKGQTVAKIKGSGLYSGYPRKKTQGEGRESSQSPKFREDK